MNVPMSTHKTLNKKRKRHHKTQNNIKKLFSDLRNDSITSFDSIDSIIDLDSPTPKKGKKRPLSEPENPKSKRRIRSNNSLIIINEDKDLITSNVPCSSTPRKTITVQCSTPINKKDNKTIEDLIVSSFGNPNNNNSVAVQNLTNEINNLTKEINRESYVTIDLTSETLNCTDVSKNQNTVIDLANSLDNTDCTVVSVSNANLSLSGESDVTVLNVSPSRTSANRQMRRVFSGISKLDSTDKNKMLEYVVKTILNGCNVPDRVKNTLQDFAETANRPTDTVENTYIKEVIIGQSQSRNSIGSNVYNPGRDANNRRGLRMVVIDGSNVAMEHGKGKEFSVKGLKICIDYFLKRGHIVKAFVPRFRCKFGKSTEPRLLDELERRGLVVYTPSREIQGRLVASYDDRYIVQCAAEFDAVIVSGDNYRDLLQENPRWRFAIENRLLPFTWVNDMLMFPKDPLGRNGPTLEQFLKHPNQPPVVKT